MEDYSFALAKRSDTPEILKLYRSLIGVPGCTWNADYPSREITEADIDAESLYVLLDKKYKIAAAVTARKDVDLDELDCWRTKNPCDLARFGVLTGKQNRGTGGFLLRKTISAVRRKGFDGMRMLVSKNHVVARKLYQRQGFVKMGETTMYDSDFDCFELLF